MSDYIEKGVSPGDLVEAFKQGRLSSAKYPEDLYERYDPESFRHLAADLYRGLNQSVYKRVQAAPIIVVSERAFGFDLRETIINGWEG